MSNLTIAQEMQSTGIDAPFISGRRAFQRGQPLPTYAKPRFVEGWLDARGLEADKSKSALQLVSDQVYLSLVAMEKAIDLCDGQDEMFTLVVELRGLACDIDDTNHDINLELTTPKESDY